MQFNVKPKAAHVLKKPSELEENKCIPIEALHESASGFGIACFCPDCGSEIEFTGEWPIDIPITCGAIQEDKSVCQCRFIIENDIEID